MRIAAEISDRSIVSVNCDSIAISVLERRGDDRTHWNLLESSDASEGIVNLTRFDFELVRVGNVLISPAAAPTEIWTRCLYTVWRSFAKLDNFRLGKLRFLARNLGGDQFAVDGERN